MTSIPDIPNYKEKFRLICENGTIKWECLPVHRTRNNEKQKLLFIIAGQSNAQSANIGPIIPGVDDIHPRIFQFNRNLKTSRYPTENMGFWIPAQHPLQHMSLTNDNSVGFGLSFAKEYLKKCGPNDEIYIVCCAMGGTGFTPVNFGYGSACWKKNFKGTYELYNMMIKDVMLLINQNKEQKLLHNMHFLYLIHFAVIT